MKLLWELRNLLGSCYSKCCPYTRSSGVTQKLISNVILGPISDLEPAFSQSPQVIYTLIKVWETMLYAVSSTTAEIMCGTQ